MTGAASSPTASLDAGPDHIDKFELLYADWLATRAEKLRFSPLEGEEADAEDGRYQAISDRMDSLERSMMTAFPASASMLKTKIEVFEYRLMGSLDTPWSDYPLVWMLGCIKADLIAAGTIDESSR